MKQAKYIVVTLRSDGSYDSILNNTTYNSYDDARAIKDRAIAMDKEEGWKYVYRIVAVYDEPRTKS